jgi:hypothetical protein
VLLSSTLIKKLKKGEENRVLATNARCHEAQSLYPEALCVWRGACRRTPEWPVPDSKSSLWNVTSQLSPEKNETGKGEGGNGEQRRIEGRKPPPFCTCFTQLTEMLSPGNPDFLSIGSPCPGEQFFKSPGNSFHPLLHLLFQHNCQLDLLPLPYVIHVSR